MEAESHKGIHTVCDNKGNGSSFIGIIVALVKVSDIFFVFEEGNSPVENIHSEIFDASKQGLFHDAGIEDLSFFAHLVENNNYERDYEPGCKEDSEQTEAETCISQEIGIKRAQFIWLRSSFCVVTARDGSFEEIREPASMHPSPSIVEL